MNTLKAYKHLISQGVPDNEAEAQVEVLEDALTNVATRDDMRNLEKDLTSQIKEQLSKFQIDIVKWIVGLTFTQLTISVGLTLSLIKFYK